MDRGTDARRDERSAGEDRLCASHFEACLEIGSGWSNARVAFAHQRADAVGAAVALNEYRTLQFKPLDLILERHAIAALAADVKDELARAFAV